MYAVGALVVASMGFSAWGGYKVAQGMYAEDLEATIAYYRARIVDAQDKSEKVNEEVVKIEYRDRYITEEIIKYVEKNPDIAECKLDADGLQLWNGTTK